MICYCFFLQFPLQRHAKIRLLAGMVIISSLKISLIMQIEYKKTIERKKKCEPKAI